MFSKEGEGIRLIRNADLLIESKFDFISLSLMFSTKLKQVKSKWAYYSLYKGEEVLLTPNDHRRFYYCIKDKIFFR